MMTTIVGCRFQFYAYFFSPVLDYQRVLSVVDIMTKNEFIEFPESQCT